MVITEFAAEGFRNLSGLSLRPGPGLNVIYGDNGQGKTNLAEGIYFLCHLKSFRTSRLDQLLTMGTQAGGLKGEVQTDGLPRELRVELHRRGRRVWQDGQIVSKTSEYISNYFAIAFNPDALYSFRNYPQERRSFFDRFFAFLDHVYLDNLRNFKHIHAQKNRLLKSADRSSLPEWNQLFIESGLALLRGRKKWIDQLNLFFAEAYQKLKGEKAGISLIFHPGMPYDEEAAFRTLNKALDAEVHVGHALHGPHRDDYKLEEFSQADVARSGGALEGKLANDLAMRTAATPPEELGEDGPLMRSPETFLADPPDPLTTSRSDGSASKLPDTGATQAETRSDTYFSQGEYRLAMVAMLQAMGALMREERGFHPLFILDDLFSELDEGVAERLTGILADMPNQVFITTTTSPEPGKFPGAHVMEIQQGKIIQGSGH